MKVPGAKKLVIGPATIYLGNCMEILATLEEASIDTAVTDPPYCSGGTSSAHRKNCPRRKYCSSDSASAKLLPSFSGDERDQLSFLFWCSCWIDRTRRLLVPGGVFAMLSDWRQMPTGSIALQCGGITWRGVFPWHKPSSRPALGRFRNACEYALWGTNGSRPMEGKAHDGFHSESPPPMVGRKHITQKPVSLMERLVDICPRNGVVIDPFMGSGTTGVACINRGRRFIGIESSPEYFRAAAERLRQAMKAKSQERRS